MRQPTPQPAAPLRHGARRSARTRPAAAAGALSLAVALAVALALVGAPAAQAREGAYAGIGLGSTAFDDGIDGTQVVQDIPGSATHEIRVAKPESATGLTMNGGLGFNDYVALDLLVTMSKHDAVFDAGGGPESYPATLSSVLLGVRGSVPLGDVAEVFGRAGLGAYELVYEGNNIALPSTPVDGSRFSGRGFAWGLGAELFLEHWGLQLAYTSHRVDFDTVVSQSFAGPVNPPLRTTLSSVALVFSYYLH